MSYDTALHLDEYIRTGCHECGHPVSNGSTYCHSCQVKQRQALGEREKMLQSEELEHLHEAMSVIHHLATQPCITMPRAMEAIERVAKEALEKYEEKLGGEDG